MTGILGVRSGDDAERVLAAGDVVVEQATLQPGAALPARIAGGWEWFGVLEGKAALRLEGERVPFRWVSGEEREFVALQPLPVAREGTTVTLHNAGEGPLVLLHLTLLPTGSATPVA